MDDDDPACLPEWGAFIDLGSAHTRVMVRELGPAGESSPNTSHLPAAIPVTGYPRIAAGNGRTKYTVYSVVTQVNVYPDGEMRAGYDDKDAPDSTPNDSGDPVTVRNLKAILGALHENPCSEIVSEQLQKANTTAEEVFKAFFNMLGDVIHNFINTLSRKGKIAWICIALSYFTGEQTQTRLREFVRNSSLARYLDVNSDNLQFIFEPIAVCRNLSSGTGALRHCFQQGSQQDLSVLILDLGGYTADIQSIWLKKAISGTSGSQPHDPAIILGSAGESVACGAEHVWDSVVKDLRIALGNNADEEEIQKLRAAAERSIMNNTRDADLIDKGLDNLPQRFLDSFRPALDLIGRYPAEDYGYVVVSGQVLENSAIQSLLETRFSELGWDKGKVHLMPGVPDAVICGLAKLPVNNHGIADIESFLKWHYVGYASFGFDHTHSVPPPEQIDPEDDDPGDKPRRLRYGHDDVDFANERLICISEHRSPIKAGQQHSFKMHIDIPWLVSPKKPTIANIAACLENLGWQLGVAPSEARQGLKRLKWQSPTVPYDTTIGSVQAHLDPKSAMGLARTIVARMKQNGGNAEISLYVKLIFTRASSFTAKAVVSFEGTRAVSQVSKEASYQLAYEFGADFPCLWTIDKDD